MEVRTYENIDELLKGKWNNAIIKGVIAECSQELLEILNVYKPVDILEYIFVVIGEIENIEKKSLNSIINEILDWLHNLFISFDYTKNWKAIK